VLRPESNRDMRPSLGWSAVSPQCSVHVMPGDHHTAITTHIEETAAILRECLDAVPGGGGTASNSPTHDSVKSQLFCVRRPLRV
jgi:hypothetical protein